LRDTSILTELDEPCILKKISKEQRILKENGKASRQKNYPPLPDWYIHQRGGILFAWKSKNFLSGGRSQSSDVRGRESLFHRKTGK